MQWQQLQFVRACPGGKKRQARRQLQLAALQGLQWDTVGYSGTHLAYFTFNFCPLLSLSLSLSLFLSLFRCTSRFIKRRADATTAAAAAPPRLPAPPAPRSAFDASKFAARQRNEAMRTKKSKLKDFFKTPFAASLRNLFPTPTLPLSLPSPHTASNFAINTEQPLQPQLQAQAQALPQPQPQPHPHPHHRQQQQQQSLFFVISPSSAVRSCCFSFIFSSFSVTFFSGLPPC